MQIVVALVIVLVIAFGVLTVLRKKSERANEPTKRAATMVGKRDVEVGGHRRCLATFRFADGDEETFTIDELEYTRLKEGATGELTYNDTKYITFHARNSAT